MRSTDGKHPGKNVQDPNKLGSSEKKSQGFAVRKRNKLTKPELIEMVSLLYERYEATIKENNNITTKEGKIWKNNKKP
jgi:hypothetical protein